MAGVAPRPAVDGQSAISAAASAAQRSTASMRRAHRSAKSTMMCSRDVQPLGEPVAFLLVVYKRRSQWPAILTGRLAAPGRRPWLAFGFAGRFHRP